ncbi:MAG: DUF3631 domain-containing protein [Acidobacteria bacterium]|nr:DUF3631 domain-containing protein [Acidobacteriota bacterium]
MLADLLDDTETYIRRYVVLDEHQAVAVTLWAAHTHAIAHADCTPYLAVRSATKRTGKTRTLEVLEPIVREPWLTGRTTAAALARKVDRFHPTLLLDESDAAFGGEPEYTEALRGLLNSGYRKSGRATVCIAGGADFADFSTFCPKAIAGIGRLPDTVADRSIPIVLRRRRRDEPCARWRERDGRAEAMPIRDRLATWAKEAAALRDARPELPDQLSDRAQDVWEPLLAIADAAGGAWPTRARRAAVALMGETPDDDTVNVQLLADIRQVFADAGDPDVLSSAEIRDALIKMEDRPWPAWGKSGKPITPHAIARRLGEFSVVPAGLVKIAGRPARAYRRATFEDAWERYLPEVSDSEALPRYSPNESGPESPETDRYQRSGGNDPKTEKTRMNTGSGNEVTLREPEKGCCEGGPLRLECRLCRQSPTYWRRDEAVQ